jgi:hypothetical protein
MFPRQACLAGVVGGIFMSGVFAASRMFGISLRFELMIGTIAGLEPGPIAWIVGFAVHLLISGGVAVGLRLDVRRHRPRRQLQAGHWVRVGTWRH